MLSNIERYTHTLSIDIDVDIFLFPNPHFKTRDWSDNE